MSCPIENHLLLLQLLGGGEGVIIVEREVEEISKGVVEGISEGDEVSIDFDTGSISDLTTGVTYQGTPFPEFMQEIINAGGLVGRINKGV